MAIYDELGIRRIINANATLTRLGGSTLAPGVAEAMAEASTSFVQIRELQRKVGAEIARLTNNQACYVSCGAAAGMTLVTASCMAGKDPALRERLPNTEGMKNEVVIHRHTRVMYDFAIRAAGANLVEMGRPEGTSPADLLEALTERTAAVFFFPRGLEERGELPLEAAVEICWPRRIPVIVDASAQIPPRTNLWSFTERGADAAIFSGGKGLRGPQSSGLVLGRQWLVDYCAFHGSPNPYLGRGMKVGKEELCGILAAMRWFLAQDEAAQAAYYEQAVAEVVEAFSDHPAVRAHRIWPCEAGQPIPRAELELDEARLGRTRDEVVEALREGEPAVDVAEGGGAALWVNPQTLEPEEVPVLIGRLREELRTRETDAETNIPDAGGGHRVWQRRAGAG
jgi:D-glucosaminate-6-phosphate ammonia-lyase